jgi:16S rRNA (uracil1498-N3)-methyltransferase
VSRFYLPPEQCLEPSVFLSGREAHHAVHVLRLRHGDSVSVLDGLGHLLHCEVQAVDRDKVRLLVLERQFIPPSPCQITLLQAVPKGKLLESIIQKATELGVARIVPVLSDRVVSRLQPQEASHKTAKWELAAIEAIKQCGATWLPQVDPPLTPHQFIARKEQSELPLIASLQPGSQHPRCCFRDYHRQHGRMPASVSIWVGPEGDFTPAEIDAIVSAGALPITLGPLILRAETAALYCLSFLRYELLSPPP